MTDSEYADDQTLHTNTSAKTESQLHSFVQTVEGIGFYMNGYGSFQSGNATFHSGQTNDNT